MKISKDASTTSDINEATADEIARTVKLATQAFDGRVLSDRELDDLCDAVLTVDEADRKATKSST